MTLRVRCWSSALSLRVLLAAPLLLAFEPRAATNAPSLQDIPPLLPPRPEIPPGTWEQYGSWIVAAAVLVVALLAGLVYFLTRPKPQPPLPAHMRAILALNELADAPEDGLLLSRISQVLRWYIARILDLPEAERTTTEISSALTANRELEPASKEALIRFLQVCDERKFAPPSPTQPSGALQQAIRLIHLLEANRPSRLEAHSAP